MPSAFGLKFHQRRHCHNYKTANVVLRVKEITEGRGVEIILNSVAGDTFKRDFKIGVMTQR